MQSKQRSQRRLNGRFSAQIGSFSNFWSEHAEGWIQSRKGQSGGMDLRPHQLCRRRLFEVAVCHRQACWSRDLWVLWEALLGTPLHVRASAWSSSGRQAADSPQLREWPPRMRESAPSRMEEQPSELPGQIPSWTCQRESRKAGSEAGRDRRNQIAQGHDGSDGDSETVWGFTELRPVSSSRQRALAITRRPLVAVISSQGKQHE